MNTSPYKPCARPGWVHKLLTNLLLAALCLGVAQSYASIYIQTGGFKSLTRGSFLVSTKQLNNTSFHQTVILVTHYSNKGATGIAINRASQLLLKNVFPHTKSMRSVSEKLFLGGPVKTDAIFVLTLSSDKIDDMQQISPNLYFSAGVKAVASSFAKSETKSRAYAGYSGWAPGQLEQEISRGDWLVIDAEPKIIFTPNYQSLWKTLFTTWSGRWI